MNLKDKTILITGGSTGIGKAIAKEFLKNKAKIIVLGLNKPNYDCKFHKVNIKNEADIIAAFKEIGKIDVIVNNAGVAKILSLEKTTTELFDDILGTNLKGTFLICRYALPKLPEKSCIINISSIAGIQSFADYGAYCASKAAVISFTKTLALELASRKIRVNCIAPGIIDTPIFSKMMPSQKERKEQLKEWIAEVPLKRFGKPEEVAHAAKFLAENEFVNGIVLPVDGGESAA
jgi:NAD(P)-dependent dehydrogenase (short-subunit alcohol dehydrogenase family)